MTAPAPSRTRTPVEHEDGPVLEVDGLDVAYRSSRGSVQALRDVSFTLAAGTRIALVGESGSGKSTIANALLGLLPDAATVGRGAIRYRGDDLLAFRHDHEWRAVRGKHIALIPQDPLISLDPSGRIGGQIVESLKLHTDLDKPAAKEEAVRLLESVGIAQARDVVASYPHELSGGQLQRVLISIALSGKPSIIVADEPTSGLDVTTQKLVLEEIDALVQRHGATLILITHDLAIARKHTDRVIVLQHGRIVEQLPSDRVADSTAAYTRQLFEAAPSRDAVRLRQSAGVRPSAGVSTVVARFDEVTKKFRRKAATGQSYTFLGVDRASFEIREGESFGLVGESGSGKSTTAKIGAGILKPDGGSFEWLGGGDAKRSKRQRRKDIQFVFQNPYSSLNPRLTIGRILREPLDALDIGAAGERETRVAEALESVGLPVDYVDRKPTELSGGQRQRIAIARAIIVEPKLLILDEPVSALDVTVQRQVLQLLVDLQARLGLSYLFISHDLAVIRLFCDQVAVIRSGVIVEQGEVETVYTQPRHEYTRELLAAIP